MKATSVKVGIGLLLFVLPSAVMADYWPPPENLGPVVNSASNENGVFIYGGALYFTSDRPGGQGGHDVYKSTGTPGLWGAPQNVTTLNTAGEERAPSIACVNGHSVIVFGRKVVSGTDFDVWTSANSDICPDTPIAGWAAPSVMAPSSPAGDDEMPYMTPDGSTLYFGSNRPGGYGGYDIWVSQWSGTSWSAPENLGPVVNTSADERGPSISEDGTTMYLGSNRPGGYGGVDIYASTWVGGAWTTPVNLGADINTADDETCPQSDGGDLYFRSTRPGGYGQGDLYVSRRSIPTVSEWGLIVLTLLLLTAGTIVFARRRRVVTA
jgi:hypothetical protein